MKLVFLFHVGRYYWQRGDKRGLADWSAIKKIRDTFPGSNFVTFLVMALDVHIIGNGNIGQCHDFERMIRETGVHAAMAG